MALDIGSKKTGVAVCDAEKIIVFPREEIHHSDEADLLDQIEKIIFSDSVSLVIVGIPLNMNGKESAQSIYTKKIADLIKSKFNVRIIEMDERFSSQEARKKTDSKKNIDSLAAAIILENYLEALRKNFM